MDSTARLKQRSEQLQNQLESFKKELDVANVNLQDIRDRAVALVEKLESAKSPQVYLKDYTKVQNLLLQYLNYVTDVNCNLEIFIQDNEIDKILDESLSSESSSTTTRNESLGQDDSLNKLDPKTEFMEKVKKLAEEEEKKKALKTEEKASKAIDPKAWTEAPCFVPKSSTETAAYVPKAPETPTYVPKPPETPPYVPKPPETPPYVPKPPETPPYVPKLAPEYRQPNGTVVQKVVPPSNVYSAVRPVMQMIPPAPVAPYQFQFYYSGPQPPPPPGMGNPMYTFWKTSQVPQVMSVTKTPIKADSPVMSKVAIQELEEEKDATPSAKVEKLAPSQPAEKKIETEAEKTEVVAKKEEIVVKKEEDPKPEAKVEPAKEKVVNETETLKPLEPEKPILKNNTKAPEFLTSAEVRNEINNVKPIPDTIPDMDLKKEPGVKYQVVFGHLVSPGEFYIQVLCPALSEMREMSREIEAHFKSEKIPEQPYQARSLKGKAKKELARRVVGRYGCCFTVDDPSWGRVEVKDWKLNEDNDEVSVMFVDYGDTKCVPLSNIQPLSPRFRKYPKFAQKCHLVDVYPPFSVSGKPMPPWPAASTTMFEILLEQMPNDFSCHIIVGENDGVYDKSSLPVNFFVTEGEICFSVNDRMVEFEAAVMLDAPPLAPDPNYKAEKKPVVGALEAPTSRNLTPGEVLSVQVTCLLKINRFYCVKETVEDDFLTKLVSFMNKPENVRRMVPWDEPPKVGDLVVGKFSEDGSWYRAKVMKVIADKYKLLFLDYGNTEVLPLEAIRKMEKKFLGYPFQLIECCLDGVEPAENVKTEEALAYFCKKVEGGGLSIKICRAHTDKDNLYDVELYNDQGENVGQDLITSRFAVSKKA